MREKYKYFYLMVVFGFLKDDSVAVRDCDILKQERIKIEELINYFLK